MANLTFDIATRGDDRAAAAFGKVAAAMDKTGSAVRKLEDQQNRARTASIAGGKAALDLAEAQKHLAKVTADGSATDETRKRAALRVEEAQLRGVKAAQALERANTPLVTSGHKVAESLDRTERSSRGTSRAFGALSASSRGVHASFRLLGTGVFAAAALLAVGVGLVGSQMKGMIAEAREAATAGKQTASVIKATGGVAHVTAQQIADLAGSISNKVGVDDEAIQSGENLLLTFKNVRNEVGKGNDIFNRAASVIVDMTAAMNNGAVTAEGLKASTIQVGKALNDPIKGITALTKVGVTFDAQQKKQIISLTEHGHALEAQKIILRELASEFGGFAAASADPMQRLGVIFGNIKETIGTALLPYVERFSVWLGERAPAVATTAVVAIKNTAKGLAVLADGFKTGTQKGSGFLGFLSGLGVTGGKSMAWVRGTAIPALVAFGKWINENKLIFAAYGLAVAQWALKLQGYVLNTVGAIIGAFGDLAGAVGQFVGGFFKAGAVILRVAGNAFGWIPGIGDDIRKQQSKWTDFGDTVRRELDGIAKGAHATGDRVTRLGGDALKASDALGRTRERINQLQSRKLTLEAIDRAKPVADRIARAIGALHSRTIQVNVTQGGTVQRVQREIDRINGRNIVVSVSTGLGAGKGGTTHNARGTRNWRGGWTTVGEEGEELVNLPKGSDVYSAQETRGMLRARRPAEWTSRPAGGGPAEMLQPIVLQLDSRTVWQGLLTVKRHSGALGLA